MTDAGRLAAMEREELERCLRERLHGRAGGGPPIDTREGPPPYEWLADVYRGANEALQLRIEAVLADFVRESLDPASWDDLAHVQLIDLLQVCGGNVCPVVRETLRRRHYDDDSERGRAVARLKVLVANGVRETPEFWKQQSAAIGPLAGPIVFAGLLEHGLATALDGLHGIVLDRLAVGWVAFLLPEMESRFGRETVLGAIAERVDGFQGELARTLRDYLTEHGALEPPPAAPAAATDDVEELRPATGFYGAAPRPVDADLVDAATGFSNRRAATLRLREELETARGATDYQFSIALLRFRDVTGGIPRTSRILQLGSVLLSEIRSSRQPGTPRRIPKSTLDFAAHLGEATFLALFPMSGAAAARAVVGRAVQAAGEHGVETQCAVETIDDGRLNAPAILAELEARLDTDPATSSPRRRREDEQEAVAAVAQAVDRVRGLVREAERQGAPRDPEDHDAKILELMTRLLERMQYRADEPRTREQHRRLLQEIRDFASAWQPPSE